MLDGASASAQSLNISTATLSNKGGSVVQTGTGAASIAASQSLDNTGGTIASNGNTIVNTGSLLNLGGTIQAAGNADLQLSATGTVDNSHGGTLTAAGNAVVNAARLGDRVRKKMAGLRGNP